MAEDFLEILTRFHREVVLPDIERVLGELRDEMNARFIELDGRLDARIRGVETQSPIERFGS